MTETAFLMPQSIIKTIFYMLRLLPILLFVLPLNNSFAADSTSAWSEVIKTFNKREITANNIKLSLEKKVLQNIEVLDMRSDTTRIGLFSDFNYKPTEFVFEKSQSLGNIIESQLANRENKGYSVLIVVQDFWLSEIRAQKILDKENRKRPEVHTSKVICRVDVFVKQQDEYFPLTRIDTTVWDKKAVISSHKHLLSDALSIIHNKIETAINDNKYQSRKKTTKENIYTAYQERFSYPAFVCPCPKKGLYTSLEEFKNNKPYAENFVIKPHQKEPPSLYIIDEKGNEAITRNVWGVSDGKNMYIMQKGMLFKLYKNENAFYWMGVKYFDFRMYQTPPQALLGAGKEVGMEEPVASNVKIRLTPYLLHPETGEGY
jgi:hypothetical protein